jgi:DNA repair ATPase RecN
MKDLFNTYFDSTADVPKEIHDVFDNIHKKDDGKNNISDEDRVIQSFSTLSNMEDRINELEEIGYRYKKGKHELSGKTKKNVDNLIHSLESDYHKYTKKFKNIIKKLAGDKEKIKNIKTIIKLDNDLQELKQVEKKIDKIEKNLKKIEIILKKDKYKLKKVRKLFR